MVYAVCFFGVCTHYIGLNLGSFIYLFSIYTHMVNLSSLTILDIIHMLVTLKVRYPNISLQIPASYILLLTVYLHLYV